MRTITLELLRHGTPHNQLLSPLTEYLALCENHEAVTLRVPFEHNQMRYRLRALSYQLGDEPREFQLSDTARDMGAILGAITGLVAEINGCAKDSNDTARDIVHLRLVLSASELAMLPFELAISPRAFPGAGQSLLLQNQPPVCITRETRRVSMGRIEWPKKPKILFAFASPQGVAEVPAQAHLAALRRALSPWLATGEDQSQQDRLKMVKERLTVLPFASPVALQKACAQGEYSHVHILAHGAEVVTPYARRYGLAFHSDRDASGTEVVDGARLSSLLRASVSARSGAFERPAFVTLASCNSGDQGSIESVGGSVAHALHEAGVPLVVASQFPLSFGGSVQMVSQLYEGLLWGRDPRALLVDLRASLHGTYKERHDWASMVAYATLPDDFDQQIINTQVQQAMGAVNNALRAADRVAVKRAEASGRGGGSATRNVKGETKDVLSMIATAKQGLKSLLDEPGADRTRILSLLGVTSKREAEHQFHLDSSSKDHKEVLAKLAQAQQYYLAAYQIDRRPWQLVQCLSLFVVLRLAGDRSRVERLDWTDANEHDRWVLAEAYSRESRDREVRSRDDPMARAWACGDLVELYLLAPEIKALAQSRNDDYWTALASEAAGMLVQRAREMNEPFVIFSTRRQLARYPEWWTKLTDRAQGGKKRSETRVSTLAKRAGAIIADIPEVPEPQWDY